MATVFRRRPRGLSPFRIVFWIAVVVVLLLFILNRHPVVLHADDPTSRGAFEAVTVKGDVLVVISQKETLANTQKGEFMRPYAWVNAFRQEYGPVSVTRVEDVSSAQLDQYRFVVITHSAALSPRLQQQHAMLEGFVSAGGVLVLELPVGTLRSTFAADGEGGWRTPSSITAVDGQNDITPSEPPPKGSAAERDDQNDADEKDQKDEEKVYGLRQALMHMPLVTRYMGSVRPLENAHTQLAMDGAPVIYSRSMGKGQVIVVDFGLSVELSALQQGTPGNHMRVHPRRAGQPIRTTDLISAPALFGSSVPYADILERFVVHQVIGAQVPLFFLWPYPNNGHGVLLSSHQSRYVSGQPLWMSVHERTSGARTVTFVAPPDPQSNTVALTDSEYVDHAALLWVVDPRLAGLQKSWGVFGLAPIIQPLSLKAQRHGLTNAFPGLQERAIHGIRTWSGRWDRHFVRPFRKMQAGGFRYDTSYGPVSGLPQGYLFGTCQPFQPVDTNGMPFSLFEVPVCFVDPSTDQDLKLVGRTLRRASQTMDVVHVLTSADSFRDAPDMRAFDAWRDMLHYARKNKMWIGGAGQFVRFRKQRQEAQLHVAGHAVERNTRTGAVRDTRYVVEIEVPGGGFSLAVPKHVGDRTLQSIVRGVALTRTHSRSDIEYEDLAYAGKKLRLVHLAPGFTTLTIRYAH